MHQIHEYMILRVLGRDATFIPEKSFFLDEVEDVTVWECMVVTGLFTSPALPCGYALCTCVVKKQCSGVFLMEYVYAGVSFYFRVQKISTIFQMCSCMFQYFHIHAPKCIALY